MKTQKRRCICLHCQGHFIADYRNGSRQRFCAKPDCRKVSKQQSQKAWLDKPANKNYFRDHDNADRVREWQKKHPGYWKNTARSKRRTLQERCSEQVPAKEELPPQSLQSTLQDLCSVQAPLFVGLISMLAGSTLQEDIASTTRLLVAKGYDILGMRSGMDLEKLLHEKTSAQSGATPESSQPVQLDRSSAGPGKLFPAL
jgi:hypothetical protein